VEQIAGRGESSVVEKLGFGGNLVLDIWAYDTLI